MKVGDRVKTIDGQEGVLVDRSAITSWQWWVTIGRCTARYDEASLTPLDEGKVEPSGWCNFVHRWCAGAGGDCHKAWATCIWRVDTPSYAARLKWAWGEEPLMICSKAGECGYAICSHRSPHALGTRKSPCTPSEGDCGATCIPYSEPVKEWRKAEIRYKVRGAVVHEQEVEIRWRE